MTNRNLPVQPAAAPPGTPAGRLFLSDVEKSAILRAVAEGDEAMLRFFTVLKSRVTGRTANPGLLGLAANVQWWYPAAEFVSDAAMLYALEPSENVAAWLRDVTLGVVRRPESDWVGPWFRDHGQPFKGHLETAHLCWATAAAYDLAKEVFTPGEQTEIRDALRQKGLSLCRRWLAHNTHLANWRGIMTSGALVAAAALGDEGALQELVTEAVLCADAFQPDGSYGESLQYGNYLAYALMLAHESLVRKYPALTAGLDAGSYARGMPWVASSMLYARPVAGWGDEPRARAVNFNDSAALFRPSGDLLLHVAVRCARTLPTEAGLALHLFNTYYHPVPRQGPHHLASFGFVNDWGFLTLPLLTRLAGQKPIAPAEAQLPLAQTFSNGNTFLRDAWNGNTVVAIQGGGDPLYGPGHLHGDLNSFMLVHRQERLLADPGHSCYRNLIHGLESASQTHNTCTFLVEHDHLGLQEDLAKAKLLEQQSVPGRRQITDGKAGPPVPRGNRRLVVGRLDEVSVVGAEAASAYGSPVEEFSRFWVQAGPHVLFVIDRIRAARPITTTWNWLLNNRDGTAVTERLSDHHLQLVRGAAGMQLFHAGGGKPAGPVYGYVHDAYHPEPNQLGEGKPGSGLLYRWTETQPQAYRLVVHAFALDAAERVGTWQLSAGPEGYRVAGVRHGWQLKIVHQTPLYLLIQSLGDGRSWRIQEKKEQFVFEKTT